MQHLQNLHTHTKFCDGHDTPEQLVRAAIARGFCGLGFSGHSYMHFSPDGVMSVEGTEAYKAEIARLKEAYRGKIDLFCGMEVEYYSEVDLAGFDYLIGSTHYFYIDGEYVGFDRPLASVQAVIDRYFGGDALQCARAYYAQIATLPTRGNFEILGHFDIISKHCETPGFLDVHHPTYLSAAYEAIDALRGKIPFFEVNTGAISRGYRTTPYPSYEITKHLLSRGFLPIISSDCHDKRRLDCAFEDARAFLEACGARERYILKPDGFCAVAL